MQIIQNKTINKRRVVNFRPFFYGFLAFCVGIAFTYFIINLNWTFVVLLALAIVLCLGFAIFKKKFINFIVIVLSLLLGVGAYFIDTGNFTYQKYCGQVCEVSGKVSTNIYDKVDYVYVILHDVSINGNNTKNLAVGITKVGDCQIESGMIIKFSAPIYDEILFENGQFNSFAYRNGSPYSVNLTSDKISVISSGNLSFAENVRLYVKNLLFQFMPETTAELSYSILFGDQVKLDSEIKNSFATSGLGHLVAVSGLNTAVLIACLYWILKKCHCTGLPRFLIVGAFLLLYCYLCSFTPSVVRASVMSLVFLASNLFGKQYDLLSSLGIAGIIILLFNPLFVFDVGFQLSFVSVVAIGIMCSPISKFLKQKIKFPKFVADAVAIDLCTTLAISPILAEYFGQISLFSPIANLICVPLFSFAYICIFALVFVASIVHFLGFLFVIPSLILNFIIWFAGVIASCDWAIIKLFSLSIIGIVGFYLIFFFFSKMFMAKTFKRVISSCVVIMIAGIMTFSFNTGTVIKQNSYTQLNSSSPCAVLTSVNGQVMVVGNSDLVFLQEYLRYNKIYNIDYLVKTTSNEETNNFIKKYQIQNVIAYTSGLQSFGDFDVMFIYQNSFQKGVYVRLNDCGFLIALQSVGSVQAQNIQQMLAGLTVNAVYQAKPTLHFDSIVPIEYIFSKDKIDVKNNFATKVNGSFTFCFENGIIGEIRSVD